MDRTAILALREFGAAGARARQEGYMRAYLARMASNLPVGEPRDDIPEAEAEARKAVVRAAKRALMRERKYPFLTEEQLAEILD